MENLKVKAEISELADNEEFRDIEGYEGLYQVTSYGRVFSLISGKFLRPKKERNYYLRVGLCKNGKQKLYLVHRIVATAFIHNPLNYKEVNHKDENPSNNHVSNLEWCDARYNCNYGTRNERILQHPNTCIKQLKSVLQFTRQGEFVAEFPSIHEAERQTKIPQSNISMCCNGDKKYSHAGGYVWRYKEVV